MARATRPTNPPGADDAQAKAQAKSEWRRAVDAGLNGASFENRLVSTSEDGLRIQPLYPDQGEPGLPFPTRAAGAWQRHEELDLATCVDPKSAIDSAIARGLHGLRLRSVDAVRLKSLRDSLDRSAVSLHPTSGDDWDANTLQVSTVTDAQHGASWVQQLALALAGGAQALRGALDRGETLERSCERLEFEVALDTDLFLSIAGLRALRLTWARLVAACDLPSSAQVVRIHARGSRRFSTRRDPWSNLLRGTSATFAAAVGGAESILTLPFDAAVGQPDDDARRMASNTQALLEEEAHLAAVSDPGAGSGYVEALTESLAAEAWRVFQEIEARDGLAAARESGWVGERIAQRAQAAAQAAATRQRPIIGVSDFPNLDEETLTRNGDTSEEEALRLSAPFEALRDRSDAFARAHGARPLAFLANVGEPVEFRPRAGFAANLLAVAGIESQQDEGHEELAQVLQAFAGSGAKICVICSSDERYLECVAPLATALRSQGAKVLLAGRAGERGVEWSAAGVEEFIHLGCDALAILERVLSGVEDSA